MKKIVVFGANGFIGKHLVAELSNTYPEVEITAFDIYTEKSEQSFTRLTNVSIFRGDFFNINDLDKCLSNADIVFHLVSTTNPALSNNDPLKDIDTNVRGSIELFNLCTKHSISKVVFLSSGGTVYGNIDSDRINEDTVPKPLSPYGIGKLTIEHYLRYFKHTKKLDYLIYRVANPYGPGQNIHGRQGAIPIFMGKFLEKKPVTIFGDGSMLRDYIYIDDLVHMIVHSFSKETAHPIYNLGSGRGTSVSEIINSIEKNSGIRTKRLYVNIPETYVHSSVLNSERFLDEFSLQPTTTLDEGIQKTWKHIHEQYQSL